MGSTLQQTVLEDLSVKNGNGVALECEGRKITFGECDAITNRIASILNNNGLHAGKTIALRMKRSERMFLAIYAIMKTGAAILPIPTSMPKKRVEEIYSQIDVDLTMTDEEYERLIAEAQDEKVSSLVDIPLAAEEDPALILFTSGSTGKPKGVVHTQKSALGVMNRFPYDVCEAGVQCGSFNTVIAKTNINFVSAYIFEVLQPILFGNKLVVLTDDEQNSVNAVAKIIKENEDSFIFLTPSQVDSFLKDASFCSAFKSLGAILLGGERTSPEVLEHVLEKASAQTKLLSGYGSTEYGLIACGDFRDAKKGQLKLLPETKAVFVDADKKVQDSSSKGELCLSSKSVFKCYTNYDAHKIVNEGVSYFCTGDIGYIDSEGDLVLRGRSDRMVKFHGMRVELADIESNICKFDDIRECAVVVNRTEAETEVLSAFYVSKDGVEVDEKQLRRFLKDWLPVNLIPVGMTQLETLPENENGKRDYKKLTSMSYVQHDFEQELSESINSEMAEVLSAIIGAIFEKDVKPEDDLFALGMDSLIAFKIISNLRELCLDLTIEDIFLHPNIAELSGLVRKVKDDTTNIVVSTYPATGVQAYWGSDVDFNKKTRGLYVQQDFLSTKVFSEKQFKQRVKTIFKNHEALRSHMAFEDGIPTQTISEMNKVCFLKTEEATKEVKKKNTFCLIDYFDISEKRVDDTENSDISSDQKKVIENFKKECMAAMVENDRVFALQVAYFQVSDSMAALVLTGNHASVDGVSLNILIEELTAECLPEEEDCYFTYLRYIANQYIVAEAIDFYKGFLAGAEFSALPEIEVEEGAELQPNFRGVTLTLGENGTKELLSLSQKEKVSPVSQILFAYGQALCEVLGKDAMIMQILTSGRGIPMSGMDRVVGCFIAYIPVVVKKDDSVETFQKNILQADQNSFAPLPLIWKEVFNLDSPPKLAPFLISEIFPEVKSDGFVKRLSEMDYEKMTMSNFIVKKDDTISVYFHYDANKLVEEKFLEVTDEMKRLMSDKGFLE